MAGRKARRFRTAAGLQRAVDAYFDSLRAPVLDKEGRAVTGDDGRPLMQEGARPCTFTGLALALGLKSRRQLLEYEGEEAFAAVVAIAKLRCEAATEERLYGKTGANGARFVLQNNYGWRERQEVDQTVSNKDGAPFLVSGLTDEELEKKLMALGWEKTGRPAKPQGV